MKKREKKLIEPLNLSKQSYYQKYFQENKKNSKKTLEGIHKIISSRKAIKDGSVSAIIIDDITITESKLKWQKIPIVSLHQLEQIYKKDSPY